MSVTALQVESLPTGGDSMRAWVESVRMVVHGARRLDVRGFGDPELVETVRSLTSVLSQITAVKLAVLAEVDRRSAARRVTGATSTAAWLRADGMGAGAASREVALAGSLSGHQATRRALADGWINPEQAQVITGALDAMSDTVDEGAKTAVEVRLLDQAQNLDAGQLRKEALAQAARVDPTGSGDLARQEKAAKAGRDLTMWRGRDGMHHLRGRLDTESAAVLAAALDPLAAPAPADDDGGRDLRSPGRRRADALVELARRALAGGGLPVSGGVRPQVVVTVTLAQLRGEIDGCAQVAGATVREPLSAGAARRIACDAGIIPAVLGSGSEILDWGRAVRTATPAQRRALALRDGGCTFPGCDRPPQWCEAHHLVGWQHGGTSDLDNLALVCGDHHAIAHQQDWTGAVDPTGRVRWTRPPDPPPPDPPSPDPPSPDPPSPDPPSPDPPSEPPW